MNYAILNNKNTIYSPSIGQNIKDLLSVTFMWPQNGYKSIFFKVTREYVARPDLISIDKYGVDDYTDIICKINGISNPFELNEGMILELPDITYMNLFVYGADDIENIIARKDDKYSPISSRVSNNRSNSVTGTENNFEIDKNQGIIIY